MLRLLGLRGMGGQWGARNGSCAWRAAAAVRWSSGGGSAGAAYDARAVEEKWQRRWGEEEAAAAEEGGQESGGRAYYALAMFPYPSGRLHMGHVRVYTISDVLARARRQQGMRVLHPFGWDSFGLPAENAARQHGLEPAAWTQHNVAAMKQQLRPLGLRLDWRRELSTSWPSYYRWTQWLFLRLHAAGLAYQRLSYVHWDPVDRTVLANEQVLADGTSWRSGARVEQRTMRQWYLGITRFAAELRQDLALLEGGWPEQVLHMQRNWIGTPSEGALLRFPIFEEGAAEPLAQLEVFTTRLDTLHGVSFLCLAPQHPLLIGRYGEGGGGDAAVAGSLAALVNRLALQSRTHEEQEATTEGIVLEGLHARNPLTGDRLPLAAAAYVLPNYASGAVMAVPAHDARDAAFAAAHGLPMGAVVLTAGVDGSAPTLQNSGQFSGMGIEEARAAMLKLLQATGAAEPSCSWKLHDWLVSRQRYWGAPIPIIHCASCGAVPVPEEQLPVELPEQAAAGGQMRLLSEMEEWKRTECPNCGGTAERETDTMDTFVDSSWYYLRFLDPHNDRELVSREAAKGMPVDLYVGGIEHAILHLLYARFIHKFLRNEGIVEGPEPFTRLLAQGMVHGRTYRKKDTGAYLTPDELDNASGSTLPDDVVVSYEKMSKSKHNGVEPSGIIEQYGADATRLFVLFKAPPEKVLEWEETGIIGQQRWLQRLHGIVDRHCPALEKGLYTAPQGQALLLTHGRHLAVKEVTKAVEECTLNTGVSSLMKLSNTLGGATPGSREYDEALRTLLVLLAPFAPHAASELWERLSSSTAAHEAHTAVLEQPWPTFDEQVVERGTTSGVEVVLQVQGKKRGVVQVPNSLYDDGVAEATLLAHLEQAAADVPAVARQLGALREQGGEIQTILVRKARLANFIVRKQRK